MKMNNYIADFTNHLNDALSIGLSSKFNSSKSDINNILICGLGGSGIGGSIITRKKCRGNGYRLIENYISLHIFQHYQLSMERFLESMNNL